jgi:uncharacterized damage-inducible protein DinB
MEPWLTGEHAHLAPIPRLLRCSLDLSITDVRRWTEPLSDAQVWAKFGDAGTVGFQLCHLAGSVDRLLTYARGEALSEHQLAFLRRESEPGATKAELLAALVAAYAAAGAFAESATGFDQPRFIGRHRLETPLGVLLAHIAEHTQRHTGQLIILCKFASGSHI